MRMKLHPFDEALTGALAAIEPAMKDRLLRRLVGLAPNNAGGGESFDALAIENIIPVTVDSGVPLRLKIGGEGNMVASAALVGKVVCEGPGRFTYTSLAGYVGRDQFAVKDGLGKVALVRITVRPAEASQSEGVRPQGGQLADG